MVDYSKIIPDAAYKDDSPLKTVARIKGILATYGIETTERWGESGVPHCYSLRLNVAGTTFGTNGKGVTREFALASAYGELMERLQLGYIFRHDQQKSTLALDTGADLRVSAAMLLERNRKWYTSYARQLFQRTGTTITEEEILKRYTAEDGTISVTPYYCINTKTTEYLPTTLRKIVYSANGCAAGNTTEEAIVQAISEIMERHNHCRILSEGIAVPDIPEEVLQKCTISYEIITFLRNNGFRVEVKDCSLGEKFPVICICLVDQRTGRYHTHFGAFPDFEIALQRTLTESFQGRAIDRIGKHEDFCPSRESAMRLKYLMRELVFGESEKTPDFFLASTDQPCNRNMGFCAKNNHELLGECIDFFLQKGYDILVRNSSCLGFPTYQVIVPGFSEVFPQRVSVKHDDMRYRSASQKVIRDPSAATFEDIMGFMMNMAQRREKQMDNNSFLTEACLQADLSAQEDAYLLNVAIAHVHYSLGKTADVIRYLNRAISVATQTDAEYLICLKRYLTLKQEDYSTEQIHALLSYFHRPATVERLYQATESNRNPLDSVVLHCDGRCRPDCLLYAACKKQKNDELSALINRKARELDDTALRELFSHYI